MQTIALPYPYLKSRFPGIVFRIVFALCYLLATSLAAQGDLLLFPKRLVFEDGKKSEIINLTNIGKDTATYRISFSQIRMNEDGGFENIVEPDTGQLFAESLLRYYPRTVTLAPNESQVVKVQVKKTNGLPEGEYRSHLYFRADKTASPVDEKARVDTSKTSVSVSLNALFGISIPTIVRIGNLTSGVTLSNLGFERNAQGAPTLKVQFNRSGNESVYGNVEVSYVSPEGAMTKVADVGGLAVYTPGKLRRATIVLKEPAGVDFSKGKLWVVYKMPPEKKNQTLARAELTLSPAPSLR